MWYLPIELCPRGRLGSTPPQREEACVPVGETLWADFEGSCSRRDEIARRDFHVVFIEFVLLELDRANKPHQSAEAF